MAEYMLTVRYGQRGIFQRSRTVNSIGAADEFLHHRVFHSAVLMDGGRVMKEWNGYGGIQEEFTQRKRKTLVDELNEELTKAGVFKEDQK